MRKSGDLEFYKNHKINRVHIKDDKKIDEQYTERQLQKTIEENNNIPPENIDYSILKYVKGLRTRMFGDHAL